MKTGVSLSTAAKIDTTPGWDTRQIECQQIELCRKLFLWLADGFPSREGKAMSDFKGRKFEGKIVLWAVRWYCRYGVSYRDLE